MKQLVIIVVLITVLSAVYAALFLGAFKAILLFFVAFCVYRLEYNED